MCEKQINRLHPKNALIAIGRTKNQVAILMLFLLHLNFISAQDCAGLDWNENTNKSTLVVSATASTNGSISVLLDGNTSNNNFYYPDVSIAGLEVLRVAFPEADILTGLEYTIGNSYMFNTNATFKVQGSTDGSMWVDMVPTVDGTSPSLVISGNDYVKDRSLGNNHPGLLSAEQYTERIFWTNTTLYSYYRILGVSGNTNQNPWINELFFQTLDGFEVSNLDCTDNGTTENFSDDQLTFDFTALRGTGTYTVSIDGGHTITPTSGTFGVATSFTLSTGSSGAGDLNLTLTDSSEPCTTIITIPNTENACEPGPCGEPDWNAATLKSNITGTYNLPALGGSTGPLTNLVDTDQATLISTKNNSFTNQPVFTCQFPQATILTGLEVNTKSNETEPITAGVFRIEGSNDGSNYTALSIDFTHGSNLIAAAPQYGGTGTLAYTFPFADNTTAYLYYRVYAVSMSTRFSRDFTEIYFDYKFFDLQMTNQVCLDNGTSENYTDDQLSFDLNPIPGTAGNTYTVDIDGGFTITPTSGIYGQVTSFTVSTGSSGAGDLELTVFDASVPCLQTTIISNTENACIPGPCGGPDWNLAAIKSTLTGDYHVPGNGCECGALAIMVDNDVTTGHGSKNNSYSNTAAFTVSFSEETVLKGMEIVTTSSPITACVMRVEGSTDGTNYTAVSIDYTLNTNLTPAAAQYGSGAEAYTLPFVDNTTAYSHYRIYAVSMSTTFGRQFKELNFNYDVFDDGLDNVSFGDNSTPGVFDDDVVDLELNPSPGTGIYSVQALGGYTVTPATGTFGQVTSFQISEGSAGTGDLTLLVTDQSVPCAQEVTIPNPDLTATVESSQATCASPTDDPLGTLTLTAADGVYIKAEYNIGTVYAGTGFASATDVTSPSSGFDIINTLANPDYTTYYTVRGYASETLFRDYVVSLDPKSCSVADLSLSISPSTDSANEGEQLVYVVTLTNAGPDPAVNVEVKVDIPAGLELLSTTPSLGDYSVGTQLWKADLVPVGNHELSITYRMK